MFYFFQKHSGSAKLFVLRIIVFQGFGLRLLFNYISSFYQPEEKKRISSNQRIYLKEIISLVTKKNFDWRAKG